MAVRRNAGISFASKKRKVSKKTGKRPSKKKAAVKKKTAKKKAGKRASSTALSKKKTVGKKKRRPSVERTRPKRGRQSVPRIPESERIRIHAQAAVKGWKTRRARERKQRAVERERMLDRKAFEAFERKNIEDAERALRAAEELRRADARREAEAEEERVRRLNLSREQQILDEISLRAAHMQRAADRIEAAEALRRSEREIEQRLRTIPTDGMVESDGSFIRHRMNEASVTGTEDYEAQILAEELDLELRQIYTTWHSPKNEYAVA